VKAYGLTDIGKIRESNQDSFAVSVDGALPVWAVVCDGMGGANGGYYASSTAVGVFSHGMDISFDGFLPKQIENLLCEIVSSQTMPFLKLPVSSRSLREWAPHLSPRSF